jgi:hypothetical protein
MQNSNRGCEWNVDTRLVRVISSFRFVSSDGSLGVADQHAGGGDEIAWPGDCEEIGLPGNECRGPESDSLPVLVGRRGTYSRTDGSPRAPPSKRVARGLLPRFNMTRWGRLPKIPEIPSPRPDILHAGKGAGFPIDPLPDPCKENKAAAGGSCDASPPPAAKQTRAMEGHPPTRHSSRPSK